MEEKRPNSKLISIGVFVVVMLLIIIVAAIDRQSKKGATDSAAITAAALQANDATSTVQGGEATPTTSSPKETAASYKSGTYTAEGTYQNPNGEAAIKITITLSTDGTITETSAIEEPNGRDSQDWQDRFISGYKSQVVGKNISTLKLGNISGSSLTPGGFNNAITKIVSQAKA